MLWIRDCNRRLQHCQDPFGRLQQHFDLRVRRNDSDDSQRSYIASALAAGTSSKLGRTIFLRLAADDRPIHLKLGRLPDPPSADGRAHKFGETSFFGGPRRPTPSGHDFFAGSADTVIDSAKIRNYGRNPAVVFYHELLHTEVGFNIGVGANQQLFNLYDHNNELTGQKGVFDQFGELITEADDPTNAMRPDQVESLFEKQDRPTNSSISFSTISEQFGVLRPQMP